MEHEESTPSKYIPTPEELAGNTWAYCYGQDVVILPPELLTEAKDGN